MEAAQTTETVSELILEEDQLRAQIYRLLSSLLVRPPDAERISVVAHLIGDESEFGRSLDALAAAARRADCEQVEAEYQDLFIGLGRGELIPFGSYYLTGFLHEKPLAKLRQDMARRGIARVEEVKEPEDHIGFLCEMMSGLIEGTFGAPADLVQQRNFFDTHLAPWAERFFEDLEGAKTASFYRSVGTFGRQFIAIEQAAFQMV